LAAGKHMVAMCFSFALGFVLILRQTHQWRLKRRCLHLRGARTMRRIVIQKQA
jgi:hypothetical protein